LPVLEFVSFSELIFRLFAQEIADIRTFECIQAAVIAVCILGEKIIKILESENVSSETKNDFGHASARRPIRIPSNKFSRKFVEAASRRRLFENSFLLFLDSDSNPPNFEDKRSSSKL
jgi:hypothetical protein